MIEGGQPAVGGVEQLDPSARRSEAAQLALRTSAGVARGAVSEAAGEQLAELTELGLVVELGDRIVLTAAGRLLANDVAVRLDLVGSATAGAG